MFTWHDRYCCILLVEFKMSIIFADQVFTDPTFFSMFVWGQLQSFVVNICTSC